MFKNIDPTNKSIKPYKVYKDFTLTHNHSASGYVVLRADGSSTFNFNTGSAASQSFGDYDRYTKKFSLGTYYDIPNWGLINKLYYRDADKPYQVFGGNQTKVQKRQIHNTARIFSIPQELFGEKIKPLSIELEDTSNGKTFIIKDDGEGNLYPTSYTLGSDNWPSEKNRLVYIGPTDGYLRKDLTVDNTNGFKLVNSKRNTATFFNSKLNDDSYFLNEVNYR